MKTFFKVRSQDSKLTNCLLTDQKRQKSFIHFFHVYLEREKKKLRIFTLCVCTLL